MQSIINYAKNPCDETREKVEVFNSGELDRNHWRNYERLQTFFKNNPNEKFEGIKNGDKSIWGKLLLRVFEPDSELFQQLKEVSPFADKILVYVDYGVGFSKMNFEDLERKFIKK